MSGQLGVGFDAAFFERLDVLSLAVFLVILPATPEDTNPFKGQSPVDAELFPPLVESLLEEGEKAKATPASRHPCRAYARLNCGMIQNADPS